MPGNLEAANEKAEEIATKWRRRIVGHGEEAPDQLLANPFNYRVHGAVQQQLQTESLEELGWLEEVMVNKRTGRVVDGHMRIAIAMREGEPTVPVKFVELTEAEELAALRSFDSITAMAGMDRERIVELEERAATLNDNPKIADMLQRLRDISDTGKRAKPSTDNPKDDEMPSAITALTKKGEVVKLGRHTLVCADCIEYMRTLPDNSVDAVVTDPPYGIAFMGKDWDCEVPGDAFAQEALRVLKPGGHMIAFAATRTVHRLVVALEDAGFEIRDMIAWLQWQGFPKSMNVSLAIDKEAGVADQRQVIGAKERGSSALPGNHKSGVWQDGQRDGAFSVTAPASEEAKRWEGWGTALKPAFEPMALARKPLDGTVAANVVKHSTGALNIDGCRIEYGDAAWPGPSEEWAFDHTGRRDETGATLTTAPRSGRQVGNSAGRFPANVYHCTKPSRSEREDVMDQAAPKVATLNTAGSGGWDAKELRNFHPTVKPVRLMRWLVRLVTPPGGTVLEPFAGSGTTMVACEREGLTCRGMEIAPEYCDIARARLASLVDAEDVD